MNKFVFFIEGQDRTGKDTLVKKLAQTYYHWQPMILHCVGTNDKFAKGKRLSEAYYSKYLSLVTKKDNVSFILNRTHLGENVNAPLYRSYEGDYVYDLEEKYKVNRDNFFLITLIDSSKGALYRDDDESLSSGDEIKYMEETAKFESLTKRSIIKNKILIDISGMSIEDVHKKVFDWIGDRIA